MTPTIFSIYLNGWVIKSRSLKTGVQGASRGPWKSSEIIKLIKYSNSKAKIRIVYAQMEQRQKKFCSQKIHGISKSNLCLDFMSSCVVIYS